MSGETTARRSKASRRALLATGASLGVALLISAGFLAGRQVLTQSDQGPAFDDVRTMTARVERGRLEGTSTKTGTLTGTPGVRISGGPPGTLTSIPAVGTVQKPRDVLYRVDDQPVVFFTGSLPQWRAFEIGMADGRDVRQLEESLHAWGYLSVEADAHFDWRTTAAVSEWQKDTGQMRTGSIERGRIWFGSGAHVVKSREAAVGNEIAPAVTVLTTAGTTKVVSVDLPSGSALAKKGGRVRVTLPDGTVAPGAISSIDDLVSDEDGKTTQPVTIALDDQTHAKAFDRVEVTVAFVSETRRDVLSVPVTALGARSGGGFVVDIVGKDGTTRSVPVEVGLFAGTRVEITGGHISAGQTVVVPS